MTSNKHFFFIDDSGSKNWEYPYSKQQADTPPERNDDNRDFWRKNYFVLSGVHISGEKIAELNPLINQKKIEYFGTKHVEIKSEWLRNPYQRKKHYIDIYGVSEENLKKFVEEFWYPLFEDNKDEIKLQAFVLDKRYFAGKRSHPPMAHLSQVLFDRVERYPVDNCIVIFDQMERAIRSKKGAQGQILNVAQKEININSFYDQYSHAEVRFEESKGSNFLQLADTVSYNVWRQFVEHGDKWDCPSGELPMYPFFEKISDNFFKSGSGQVAGYGIVKHPNPAKVPWGIYKNQKKTS